METERETYRGLIIRYMIDEDCSSPRENDNVGTMATWHRRYRLGDVRPDCSPEEYIANLPEDSIVLPLYLYDHSGITMRTSPFSCPWDSGQVGVIHVDLATVRKEWGDVADARDKAIAYLQAEVDEYSQFIEGECYGYIIETDSDDDTDTEPLDSCWGFIGREWVKQAAHESADYYANKRDEKAAIRDAGGL